MDHGVNQHQAEDPAGVAWNQRLGIQLFFLYAAVYLAYMAICVFWPDFLDVTLVGGLVNSVVFGFGLILLAMVLALIYGLLCRSTEAGKTVNPPAAGEMAAAVPGERTPGAAQ